MTKIRFFNMKKAWQNYSIDVLLFFPFILLLLTGGIAMFYHAGNSMESEILNVSGNTWYIIHKTASVVSIVLAAIHLALHGKWLKRFVTGRLADKNKKANIALLVIFLLATLTALSSWFFFSGTDAANGLRGIHSKLGLLLIVFFVVHLKHYFGWFSIMTRKIFTGQRYRIPMHNK